MGSLEEVRRRILVGNFVLSSSAYEGYYEQAQRVRALVAADFAASFDGDSVDVMLIPTTPTPAFAASNGVAAEHQDPVDMYAHDVFTVGPSLAGLPAMSVPTALSPDSQLPIGMQLVGPAHGEEAILRVGKVLEMEARERCPRLFEDPLTAWA